MGGSVLGEFMVPSDEPSFGALVGSLLKLELGEAQTQGLRLVLVSQDGDVLWEENVIANNKFNIFCSRL